MQGRVTLRAEVCLFAAAGTHNGEYAVILRYAVSGAVSIALSISAFDRRPTATMRRSIDDLNATHVWIHVPTPKVQEVVEVALGQGASHLLKRGPDSGWQLEWSWRYRGNRLPSDTTN